MTKTLPRVLTAGTSSGSGKTTAVCAILTLLKRRGIGVASCKCGPDYIDPMFHESVLGIPSANLAPFFCRDDFLRYLLSESGNELAVIEGFLNFVSASRMKGVLFNNITAMTYANLKKQMEARFGDAVRTVGYIPKLPEDCVLTSRHLGLITAAEIGDLREKLGRTVDLCSESIALDAILKIASSASELDFTEPTVPQYPRIRIAAAKDRAFCFTYRDTLRLLEKMGAEILPFSPLADEAVPEEADGLLLSGGYPELYADLLEKNEASRKSIRTAIENGMPTIAECGGFQYLGQTLEGRKMCGVLPHDSVNTGKLVRFGYITMEAKKDGLFGSAGTTFRAHEFHYYDSTDNGNAFTAVKSSGRSWDCVQYTDTLYAGYPHLFLPANIPAAEAFYRKCLAYKEKKL